MAQGAGPTPAARAARRGMDIPTAKTPVAGPGVCAKKDLNHRATENTEEFIEFVFNSVFSVALCSFGIRTRVAYRSDITITT